MKKICMIFLGIIAFGVFNGAVKADNISYKRLDNVYFNLNVDGISSSNHVTMFYLDGRLAYCIEPGIAITTGVYNADSSWNNTSFNVETQKYLEKLGYYGYEYYNHQTPRYYIATQELIWQAIKNVDIYWTTGPNGTGEVIDVSNEKNEILSLIKKHELVPSFTGDTITGEKGSHMTLYDDNMVLDNFELSKSNNHNVIIKDNNLVIDFSEEIKEEQLTLTRKNNVYDDLLLVYTMPGSQALAALRISVPETYQLAIKSVEQPQEVPKKEIVRVPSTGDDYRAFQFNSLKFYKYDFSRFY